MGLLVVSELSNVEDEEVAPRASAHAKRIITCRNVYPLGAGADSHELWNEYLNRPQEQSFSSKHLTACKHINLLYIFSSSPRHIYNLE
jgi:hypothetical protein